MIAEMPETAPITSLRQRVGAATWQRELAAGYRDPAELLRDLGLSASDIPGDVPRRCTFPLRVPRAYARRMRRGDPHDPLLRQVLPTSAEAHAMPGFDCDPVGDQASLAVPGLLHKYHGRVLLLASAACAVHCRYCFRRHFPYREAGGGTGDLTQALDYVAARSDLREVILSGGDPLVLPDERLRDLVRRLEAIPHLQRLRIHSRLPVVLPSRVDDALLSWLRASRLQVVLVIHANHGNEIDGETAAALTRLRDTGITLLNQSVLLRGVNDDAGELAVLSEKLFAAGVLPYYLHLLDRVQGAAHFEVPAGRARTLHRELRARLPGYLVPRLVQEVAGAPSKQPLCQP